jgi:hypothetical protein
MTDTKLRKALRHAPFEIKQTETMTPFKLAMGSNPECIFEDAVKSYRAFYHTKQDRFKMVWSKRIAPSWWNSSESLA